MLLSSAVLHKKSIPVGGSFSSDTPGSGNFSVPLGVTSINIKIWGAGASGARGTFGASGGGAGAYCEKNNVSVTPGQNIPYTIGLRGLFPDTYISVGNSGGATTILELYAGGGNRGKYIGYDGFTPAVSSGGTAIGGDINISGGDSSANWHEYSQGGQSPYGGAGGLSGFDGEHPGGGGGGSPSSPVSLGNGANGRLVITW